MSDSKKYFFPLAVVCILVVIFLVRCGKGSNANNISFTTEQQEEIKTIVDHVSSWSKDLPISPARKPNKIAITQCNGKTYFSVIYACCVVRVAVVAILIVVVIIVDGIVAIVIGIIRLVGFFAAGVRTAVRRFGAVRSAALGGRFGRAMYPAVS